MSVFTGISDELWRIITPIAESTGETQSVTLRIPLEAYRLIRDTVAATGERPGDVVLRALKGAYGPVAQTSAPDVHDGVYSVRLDPRAVKIVKGTEDATRLPSAVVLQNALTSSLP